MTYMAGRNAGKEILNAMGIDGKGVSGVTVKAGVRGAVVVEVTHLVTVEQFSRITEVLRDCADSVDIRHGFAFSGEARELEVQELDTAAVAGE